MSIRHFVAAFCAISLSFAAPLTVPTARAQSVEDHLIEVMFSFDSQVRLRGGVLVDLSGGDALAGVDAVLASTSSYEWSRLCDVPEETLDDLEAQGEANTGEDLYNLNNIYRLTFDGPDVWLLSEQLEALPGIMQARPVALPAELPLPGDYQPSQNYEDPATSVPTGIDAEWAWTVSGGDGSGVTVCDLEYNWNFSHQDLTKAPGSQINTNFLAYGTTDHGTAVLGELVSDNNSPAWGTKGICYGANLMTCGTYFGGGVNWNVPGAIAIAAANLSAGDIILLEQQWDYYPGNQLYVPIEFWLDYGTPTTPPVQTYNAVYAAIVTAVANGIHVVEAGGNGYINTDGLTWIGDSGAIVVGAGGAYSGGTWPQGNLERLAFSDYGQRFNLQGWGENVVTTGYGTLYNAGGVNLYYANDFSGTSSASPIVAGAVACVQGYYAANISSTPMTPAAMRSLLASTGTPQYFGLSGNIGPRPDCKTAILSIPVPQQAEYGDAPEGALAYPPLGIMGMFPTCTGGPVGFITHGAVQPTAFFGTSVDYETDGNAGNCTFPPYDADECWNDGDAGLLFPPAWTIDAQLNYVPCNPPSTGSLGAPCTMAFWSVNLDILVSNPTPVDAIVNVLMDWDQNGAWGGSSTCPTGSAPEHVLINFVVPAGYTGPLSVLNPPSFLIGPKSGYVWTRFTVSGAPVGMGWTGAGSFQMGETCDYLLSVEGEEEMEYGDAPENAPAYPPLAVTGQFPTCVGSGPAGYVSHAATGTAYFGPSVDFEFDGNAGNCPNFPPYDADECFNDGDAGLMFPPAWTIDGLLNYVLCDPSQPGGMLGAPCTYASWGTNLDIFVVNNTPYDRFVNVLFDWDLNGQWGGAAQCPTGAAPEHVLVDFLVPPGFIGPLSSLVPPSFLIGPNLGYVWSRFTISDTQVGSVWDGSGQFGDGETCDYLLEIGESEPELEYGDAPEGATAYPSGIMGQFPTCVNVGPAGYVSHAATGTAYFGPSVDFETEGNAGNCPNFPPYDADECFNDGDAGLLFPPAWTLDAALNVVPCDPNQPTSPLGLTCANAAWGQNLDIQVVNNSQFDRYVNVLFDWNQDGQWNGSSLCPSGASAAEHVLVNFIVPAGYSGPLSGLTPPGFLIGPNDQYVWSRFTISDTQVAVNWDGSGSFEDGETCDYLLSVRSSVGVDEGEVPITTTRLLASQPNPFSSMTTIRVELAAAGPVSLGIFDVAGRRIRSLAEGTRGEGHYAFTWDGRNDAGGRAAAGFYFVRLRAGGVTHTSPVILLR